MSQDKDLTCKECGETFVFTAGEQEFFQSRGFSEPIRCKTCRDKRKAEKAEQGFGGGGFGGGGRRGW
ncbi:MAG: cytochrome C551 [Armatimonadetes bacterium]|jgi:N-acetylglutamate synthase-like GNAT family acetyltransferase|nr:cytochrome C551 [Armatimonadota bacterium]